MGRLEITTHIGCPINCTDCPQELLRSKYQGHIDLDFESYKKALSKVPKDTRIDFSGMCEPFANKRCTDMILYAFEQGYPLALYTTLQGATMEDYYRLKDVKYEICVIHLPDAEGRSHFVFTDEYLELLNMWQPNWYFCHGTVHEKVRPFLKQLPVYGDMNDRAGNVECREHRHIEPYRMLTCATSQAAMNHNVLLPNGDVLMCCMDYGMTGRFGNLFIDSYETVLNSSAANAMRETLNYGESICRHCIRAIPI